MVCGIGEADGVFVDGGVESDVVGDCGGEGLPGALPLDGWFVLELWRQRGVSNLYEFWKRREKSAGSPHNTPPKHSPATSNALHPD